MAIEKTRTNTAKWDDKNKRWRITAQRDGARREFYSSIPGRTGQREANGKADVWLAGETKAKAKRIRVNAAVEEFMLYRSGKVAEQRKEPIPQTIKDIPRRGFGSYKNEIQCLKQWLIPKYGEYWVDKLCDADVQDILDSAAARGLAKKTIQGVRAAIAQFLKFCRRRNYTRYKPDEIEIPKSARAGTKKILQSEDVIRLFSSDLTTYRGRVITDPLIHAYRLAVLTGLRPGELVGLEWSDWDGSGILRVSRSINNDGFITQGKNANALRDIRLSLAAQRELYAQKVLCPQSIRIFENLDSSAYFRVRWNAYRDHNNMAKITPYEMRHTFVSIARNALPDRLLKPVIGHSKDMDTHGTYGHSFDGYEDDTGKFIDDAFLAILSPESEES